VLRIANTLGKEKGGAEAFREHWKRDRLAERQQAHDDEETRPA
jgi:hypothetical protein